MSKYDIRTYNIPLQSTKSNWTDEQREEYNRKIDILLQYGVNIAVYDSGDETMIHPDGIHNYRKDSALAKKLLLRDNKELPDDLKERLLYYKDIMEK